MQRSHGKLLKEFTRGVEESAVLADIKRRVEEWAGSFPMPGFDVSAL